MIARYRVVYSPRAYSELAHIFTYIARDSVEKAEWMIDTLVAGIATLAIFPKRQRVFDPRSRLPHVVYSFPIRPYVVFYRLVEADAVVRELRIRHGAQRPLKRF